MASDVIIYVKRSLFVHPKILLAHTPTRNKWIWSYWTSVKLSIKSLTIAYYSSWIIMVFRDRTNLILDQSFPDRTHSICGSWRSEVWGSPRDISCPSRNSPRTTLFLLYINDLPLQVSSLTTRLFADDCIVYREIDSPADAKLLQHDLHALQNWERTWLMSFNPKKCSVMSFRPCRNSHNIKYTIHETVLTRSKTYKYLGLHLSDDFKWTTHISRITKKAYQQLCLVRRNTRNLPKSFRETAYKSLLRPHVEYCSSVWDPHTLSDTQKIERIQRQAARYVTGDYRRSSSVLRCFII